MKPAGQPKQPGCREYPKIYILHMLERKFFCNVNSTRALICIGLLVMSH